MDRPRRAAPNPQPKSATTRHQLPDGERRETARGCPAGSHPSVPRPVIALGLDQTGSAIRSTPAATLAHPRPLRSAAPAAVDSIQADSAARWHPAPAASCRVASAAQPSSAATAGCRYPPVNATARPDSNAAAWPAANQRTIAGSVTAQTHPAIRPARRESQ